MYQKVRQGQVISITKSLNIIHAQKHKRSIKRFAYIGSVQLSKHFYTSVNCKYSSAMDEKLSTAYRTDS